MKPGKNKNSPYANLAGVNLALNGKALDGIELLSLVTAREANRVPWAVLHLREGDVAKRDFPAIAGFKPGDKVSISVALREEGEQVQLFEGEVVGLQVKLRQSAPVLIVELKDPLIRLTQGRNTAVFADSSDSDAMLRIMDSYQFKAEVEATKVKHTELVQFNATDWDFILTRAEANGMLVYAQLDKLEIKVPESGTPEIRLGYGDNLLDFDAAYNVERTFPAVEAGTWEEGDLEWEVAEETVSGEGLDGIGTGRLWHGGHRPADEMEAWNKASKERIEGSQVKGRATAFGMAATLGQTLELEGVGSVFSGNHLVTGVRHEINQGTWTTHLQFGMHGKRFGEDHPDLNAPPAGGMLPAVPGLQVGIVDQVDGDPAEGYRIGVRIGKVQIGESLIWARLATWDAGNEHGAFFVPDPGDQVVLGFLEGDPRDAIVLGALWGKKNTPPEKMDQAGQVKGFYSEEKSRIVFNEEYKSIEISTADGDNSLTIDGSADSIHMVDKNGNEILFDSNGILISSNKDIEIKAKGNVTISGINVEADANANLTLSGTAGTELSSSAITTVKGSLIKLN